MAKYSHYVYKYNYLTLVGYGDIYPKTNFGKFFLIISCIFGIFLLSMLVAVISLYVRLEEEDKEEYKTYNKLIQKDFIDENMNKEIKNMVNLLGTMYKYKKEGESVDEIELNKQKLFMSHRLVQFNTRKK
jgi:hypothetical protein